MKKHNKALLCAFSAALSLAAAVPAAAYAAESGENSTSADSGLMGGLDDPDASGWLKDNKGCIYYRDGSGKLLTGEQTVDGEVYLFSKNGVLKTGWRTVGGMRKYYDAESGRAVYGWIDYCGRKYYVSKESGKVGGCINELDGKLYYMKDNGSALAPETFTTDAAGSYYATADGSLAVGEQRINGFTYRFDDKGVMATGWVDTSAGAYYFDPVTALPAQGWLDMGGDRYFIAKESGRATGKTVIGGIAYDFGEDGKMKSGWVEHEGVKRYFGSDHVYYTGLCKMGDDYYVFGPDGALASGLFEMNGSTYCADSNGIAQKGLVTVDGKVYFFDDMFCAKSGVVKVDENLYLFGDDFVMMTNGFKEYHGKTYYLGEDGSVFVGRLRIGTDKYLFNEDGTMQTGWGTIEDKKYYFEQDGKMVTGWKEIDGQRFFFNTETGVMSVGRVKIGENKYYFNPDGVMHTGWLELDDGTYYFGEDGIMVTDRQIIDGAEYYFDPATGKRFRMSNQIDVQCILQNPELPTGCEVTSLTILLNHLSYNVDKLTMSRDYLPKMNFYNRNGVRYGADPKEAFVGNPESPNSYGCYAPCIVTAANKYLTEQDADKRAFDVSGQDLDRLLIDYVNLDRPVIIWITMSLVAPYYSDSWTSPSGEKITWLANEHCVVLTGYDKDKGIVYVSDPLRGNVSYSYDLLKQRFVEMGSQAVCIKNIERTEK